MIRRLNVERLIARFGARVNTPARDAFMRALEADSEGPFVELRGDQARSVAKAIGVTPGSRDDEPVLILDAAEVARW